MRIFVAGASGVVGRRLVPILLERGHDVVGLTRTAEKRSLLEGLGARVAVADALEAPSLEAAVADAAPHVLVHQLTAIPDEIDLRHYDRTFAMTNRLRMEGADNLLAAARVSGARRIVAQSLAAWLPRALGRLATEDDPHDPEPPKGAEGEVDALRYLERAVTEAGDVEGVVLRYGLLYGPGTSMSLDPVGQQVSLLRNRQFPVVGSGDGVWSFVHVDDAVAATVEAIERVDPGIYNVVDDDPAPVRDWLPAAAAAVGAPRPRRVPRWLGRLLVGAAAVSMMTEWSGASNAKITSALGWSPRYASWRDGFREGLG